MAFVHVGRRGSGRATRLTRSTAREARPRRRGGDLVRSGAPDMSGISRQSEKPRGIPDSAVVYVRTLGSRTGRAHVVSCWPGAGEILRVRVRENVHGECRGAPLRVREHVRNYRKGKLRVDS